MATDSDNPLGLIAKIRANGAKLSPLLQVPWVTNEIFRVDWLHAADQGVTAEIVSDLPDPILDRFLLRPQRGAPEVAGTRREEGHQDNVFLFS